jgi:hypothetical protein
MGFPIPMGGGMGGLGLVLVLAVVGLQMCGGGGLLGGGSGGTGGTGTGSGGFGGFRAPAPGGEMPVDGSDTEIEFVRSVTQDVQVSWQEAFDAAGRDYEETTLVVFEEQTDTACGFASAATGPFYCPADRKVYLDLSFFRDLSTEYGAPGDFAGAYVIAHEFGHHVQTILGISDEVRRLQQSNPDQANGLSVRMELQADCFAGVWAHSVWTQRGDSVAVEEITEADIREGLEAAAAVGDDRLQRRSGREINPESWTHGSSEQRMEWFRRGFDAGTTDACDTFGA